MGRTGMDPKVRTEAFKIGFATVLLLWLGRHLGGAVWWLVRQPALWVAAVSWYVAWRLWTGSGPLVLVGVAVVLVLSLIAWRVTSPGSFRGVVAWPVRSWWRRVTVYRSDWQPLMTTLKLTAKDSGDELLVPELLRVRSTATVDKVRVRMLPGQVLADFAKNADRFATTFQAIDCRVRSIHRPQVLRMLVFRIKRATGRIVEPPAPRPSRVLELWFLVEDPLNTPTPMFAVPDRPNLKALGLAVGEDGLTWNLRLLANHLLIIGATGAGKGSVLWSLVRSLGHGIRVGLVELWVVDPKGGMEFAAGQSLCARYCYGDDDTTNTDAKRSFELTYAEFLEAAVAKLRERQRRLRGIFRMHRPAPGDPLLVILIDEIASLTAYVTDRDAKKRIEAALNLLLSQGRAVGVVVVGAGQDARKEVVAMRGLFPTRVALRLNEADEADMVLGTGSRDRGARCEEIPTALPGVGYVRVETNPEPIRVRFAYIDDDEIHTMCSLYAPGAKQAAGLRIPAHASHTDTEEVTA
ncbi:FtsK/SpoIIIE domain-containing protein [Actinopolymorpha pittospori]|uniref:S-DNA-T family DNA segregation ATPase FtsK/SpoIIIE n=1 Tax=Actinopolymorpha pittospori TaxID=648752 RepID=A0A927N4S4_9ACTN|nr:FtsK/SpoIIIE domain-containing protein [Actinopolymorpha pittospori]MBE1610973.1 S-DNA-T family DNA segregation ATPase FtsK/SpoIIIE [Actinopolymorpha pittospori]